MPYIAPEDREQYELALEELTFEAECKKGELTYVLYAAALEYIEAKGVSYTTVSDAISCLTDAAEEIRRRILNPYEDKKIEENGDV